MHYIRSFLMPDVILLEGRTANGGTLSILRAGISDRQTAYFFAGQVFEALGEERALGRVWLWALPALARKHGCGFVLVRVSTPWAGWARRFLRRADLGVFHLPAFLGVMVDVSDKARLLRCHSLSDDVRKINRRCFQFSISTKRQDLATFIQAYHDPYVEKVHGFGAIAMDFNRLLASCSNDEMPDPWRLLKVECDGEWVAGMLLMSGTNNAALMELGVKDADRTLVKGSALQAAYWLSIEYLRSQGHKWVSFKHAPPFLGNGVLRYKLKYGPVLKVARPRDGFLLLSDRNSEVAREVLLREAFLVFHGDGLRAVWFARESSASPDRVRVPIDLLHAAGIEHIEQVILR